jgi:outer membrane autotransporter protein
MIANIGRNTYDSARHAVDPTLGTFEDYASGTQGNQYAISISSGYDFNREALTLNPYGRLEYILATVDGFAESGGVGNQGAISVGDQRLENTLLTLGGQASYALPLSWGILVPNARIEFQRQAEASHKDVTAQLVLDASANADVPQVPVNKSFGNYSVGFSVVLPHGFGGYFTYERSFGKDAFSDQKYTLGLRAEF